MKTAPKLTEKAFMEAVLELARFTGWTPYHVFDSRRSAPGFPDLVLVRARHPVLFIELKTDEGKLTDAQRTWINKLRTAGADARVWRPQDWAEIERTLNKRREERHGATQHVRGA